MIFNSPAQAMVSPLSLNRSIQLSFYDWEGRSEILETVKTCQESITKKRLVSFNYTDKDGAVTDRMVEPYELHFSESSWYLKGFCLHRQGSRTFKLSRIDHISMDERAFHPRDDWSEQGHEASYLPQFVTIKAWISPSIKDQIIERYGRRSIEDHRSGFLLATIYVPQNRMGFQLLASFGTHLKVVEPKTYVEDFRNYLYQMMDNYS